MPSQLASRPRVKSRSLLLSGLLFAIFITLLGIRFFIARDTYSQAHTAYEQANCAAAIPLYDDLIDTSPWIDPGELKKASEVEREECIAFQVSMNLLAQEDFSGALISFDRFAENNPDSPLATAAHARASSIFSENDILALAEGNICNLTKSVQGRDLIPDPEVHMPLLYYACGFVYEGDADYAAAVDMYERFLDAYPEHPYIPDVENALARAIVAGAKAAGAAEIAPPERSGSTNSDSTLVIIRNDSPEQLRIVFNGPEIRVEELPECPTCTRHFHTGLATCTGTGPVGSYTLLPGKYDVVVESTSDAGTTPWVGRWTLGAGDEYSSCFFIVLTLIP